MTALEIAMLWVACLLVGALAGALVEIRRLHRTSMEAWMRQASAQDEAARLEAELADALKRLGALQASRGEVL
jgi:hypothetical protein